MSYTIKKNEIIDYTPETLKDFYVDCYEWIDNLNFTIKPSECLNNYRIYTNFVKEIFLEAGWNGDGEIELMWIPPFAVNNKKIKPHLGLTVWHVKQVEDGISWILSPIDILNSTDK